LLKRFIGRKINSLADLEALLDETSKDAEEEDKSLIN
jgi:hypothetical protein